MALSRTRRWPVATAAVLTVTVVLTVLQFPFPEVRQALWRDPAALAAGQWWRLVTPLLVQYDPVWQIVVVLGLIAGLLGAVCAWMLSPAGPHQARVRTWAVVWPLVGLALSVTGDLHGPPLLLGFALGGLMLWRDRRREPAGSQRHAVAARSSPPAG
jgi:hypothetical protein